MKAVDQAQDRNSRILGHLSSTLSYQATGSAFGLTRQRVEQLVKKLDKALHERCKRPKRSPFEQLVHRRHWDLQRKAEAAGEPFRLRESDVAELLHEFQEHHPGVRAILFRKNPDRAWTRTNLMVVSHSDYRAMLAVKGTAARVLGIARLKGRDAQRQVQRLTLLQGALGVPRDERPLAHRYRRTLQATAWRGLPFTLTYTEYKALFGDAFMAARKWKLRPRHPSSPCLIMIDKTKGYVPGNVRVGTFSEATASRRTTTQGRKPR